MPKFNERNQGTKTVNRAGGEAYKQTPELELVSLLLTSFVQNKYYESASQQLNRLSHVLDECDPMFAAKAAVYARNEFGMRSITHAIASLLAPKLKATSWGENFYTKVIRRPDDITEILSYHFSRKQKLSKKMQKGLAQAFNNFDEYQLAKYKGENRNIKLVDALNILHPVPKNEKQSEIFSKLTKGELKSKDTWEAKLSATKGNKEEKKAAWADLIDSGKIGYFALLRNLRNIASEAPEKMDKVIELLTDPKRIKNSLVLPFRFLTAMDALRNVSMERSRDIFTALEKAINISVDNVPEFDGKNLVVLDVSGSMTSRRGNSYSPAEIGAVFAMALYKKMEADFLTFDSDARYVNLNPGDSLLTLTRTIRFDGGGTNVHTIFWEADRPYKRIIILTDGQGWMGRGTPSKAVNDYRQEQNCNPIIYNFDLGGYGDMQFPESNTYCIAGFSEKVFDIMKLLETDPKALQSKIDNIDL
jgi:predicted metal-dependent peptidase